MFKKSNMAVSCLQVTKQVNTKRIRFDLEVQRRSVWTIKQKQDLMDSLIHDYPVPPVMFVEKGDSLNWCLDGQQRCRAISEFLNGEYPLSTTIADMVDDDESITAIAGLKYDELPANVVNKLNATNISTFTFKGMTPEEIATMFVRLNSGTPMKKIELTRVHAGADVMAFVNEVSATDFFVKKTSITDKSKVHFQDHEAIFQSLALMEGEDMGFSGKEIEKFAIELKDEMSFEFKNDVLLTSEYLNEVFDKATKYLKKGSIPVVFYVANKARKAGIAPETMTKFYNNFFGTLTSESEYVKTIEKDSAKKAQVVKRLSIVMDAYENMEK